MILKAEAFQLPSVCHEVQRHGYATDLGMAATQIPWVKHGGFTIQKTALIADVEWWWMMPKISGHAVKKVRF